MLTARRITPGLLSYLVHHSMRLRLLFTGNCIYSKAEYPRKYGERSRLVFSHLTGTKCVKFFLHMFGAGVGQFNMYIDGVNVIDVMGSQGNSWLMAQVEINGSNSEARTFFLSFFLSFFQSSLLLFLVFLSSSSSSSSSFSSLFVSSSTSFFGLLLLLLQLLVVLLIVLRQPDIINFIGYVHFSPSWTDCSWGSGRAYLAGRHSTGRYNHN